MFALQYNSLLLVFVYFWMLYARLAFMIFIFEGCILLRLLLQYLGAIDGAFQYMFKSCISVLSCLFHYKSTFLRSGAQYTSPLFGIQVTLWKCICVYHTVLTIKRQFPQTSLTSWTMYPRHMFALRYGQYYILYGSAFVCTVRFSQ
jgi:hypothetical protein